MNLRTVGILLGILCAGLSGLSSDVPVTPPLAAQAKDDPPVSKRDETGMVFRPLLVAGVIPVPWMRVRSVTLETVNGDERYRFEEMRYHYRGGPPLRPESWYASTRSYTELRSLVESDRPKESGGLVRRPPGRAFVAPTGERTGTPGYEAVSYALLNEAPYPIPLDLGVMCTHFLLDPSFTAHGIDAEVRAMSTKAARGDIVFYYTGTKATYVARVYAVAEDGKIAEVIGKWGREEIWIHPPTVTPEGYGRPRLLFRATK